VQKIMMQRTVIWKPVEYQGMEYLSLREVEDGFGIDSVVIAVQPEGAFRLDYRIQCDLGFAVRDVQLTLSNSQSLHLSSDGHGNWFDENRRLLPDLKGCIDVDILSTPFTNTLPIKRLAWTPGQTETLYMVYFTIPDMTIHADEQRYTCVERTPEGGVFRFEQVATSFTVLLPVDADGLVLDYPGLFERINNAPTNIDGAMIE
jgi:uncharacterized protein